MSCFGLQLTCRQKPEWMRTLFLTDVSQSQYEREIARLDSEVRRLEGEIKAFKAINEDNCVLANINGIRLERWINEHLIMQNGSFLNLSLMQTCMKRFTLMTTWSSEEMCPA